MHVQSVKMMKIEDILQKISAMENDTLKQVAEVILSTATLYDKFLSSWITLENKESKWSAEEIKLGKNCSIAGLDVAYDIVIGLGKLYLSYDDPKI